MCLRRHTGRLCRTYQGEKGVRMETSTNLLQDKLDSLYHTANALLHPTADGDCIFVDDFACLNQAIHEQINTLYPYRGKTADEEAALCLALLMGYSVSLYANPDDEAKKQVVLDRSREVLTILPSSLLKDQLLAMSKEYENI